MTFYVYGYFEPDSCEPFYIGKGSGNRAFEHLQPYYLNRKTPFANKLKSLLRNGFRLEIHFFDSELCESDANDLEHYLIQRFGRRPYGPLLNLTDGGEGSSEIIWSDETRQKQVDAWTDERKRQLSERMKGNTYGVLTTGRVDSKRRKIACFGPTLLKVYDFVREVERDGYNRRKVQACLQGNQALAHGLRWEYIE